MSPKEKKLARFLDKLAHIVIDFHIYFYFLFSILIIVSYYLCYMKLFNVLFIIMISAYVIELLCGFDRNFLGFIGIIISSVIGYLIYNNINGCFLVITFAILIINVLKFLFFFVINKCIKK